MSKKVGKPKSKPAQSAMGSGERMRKRDGPAVIRDNGKASGKPNKNGKGRPKRRRQERDEKRSGAAPDRKNGNANGEGSSGRAMTMVKKSLNTAGFWG